VRASKRRFGPIPIFSGLPVRKDLAGQELDEKRKVSLVEAREYA